MSKSDGSSKPNLADGINLADVPEGHLLAGVFHGKDVVLARSGGHFYAVEATCTHQGAPLADGIAVAGRVHCPWHHARFSLVTGEAVAAPALLSLGCFRTAIREDKVFVTEAIESQRRGAGVADPRHVVIVGAGAAGYACAEMLAREQFGGRVTLVSDDPEAPYDRTQCSKQYLAGEVTRSECRMQDLPPVIRRLPGEVTAIDSQRRSVTVGDASVTFDVLVLATGARPRRSELPGFDGPNVYTLRTLQDADAIVRRAQRSKRAAILGASFLGLEVAASIRQRGLDVDVIAPDDEPLAKSMGSEIGSMIRSLHEEKGVRFHLGCQAQRYDGRALHLSRGKQIEADFVVTAIGVVPNTKLAADAGLRCAAEPQGGVLVNARLESSVSRIYAVGDIATYPDAHSDAPLRVEHWVHAQRQGQFVARAILGHTGRFVDVPFFWSLHYETGLSYLGHVSHIAASELEGSIRDRDFSLRMTGRGPERALVTCNRDLTSLLVESRWDEQLSSRA